ncbi:MULTISPECIES: tyrosine--tRNA ligase [Arcobacteraceae]|uniref:Tyrosine--tRNA ligase n=6 Tax=Aliarcobacter butzleri TaxID=28197 RepID=A8ESI5_ALIB4|nr:MULTISPECIES: tyrosine--tRNA ligase [Arcobacteraceae]ABV66909.1 tyrosyl-tRNA synthetase [Aliarcobacter butzleri RM4018]KLD97837.1 tyrosyl-tRNA synthetase [Aliarcobacter butzleri L348]KLE04896.1 tyrosyl-tRNA synthetase [Aliarcobacter butzleri L352]KLE10065.1 tyrosyl-tRNA synthetase [Aliarcobacter butzleri L355]MBF7066606.1 tyrosine--tRNA ligase [Aliarcobacter butzleri]
MDNRVLEALNEIKRGVAEIIDFEAIEKLIKRYFETGENFYVKAGFDPTAPDIHLGHTVLIQKLALFQKFGGIVQFLIGDFTATIGDPTGKSETRKVLSREQVLNNAETYKQQVFKILDENKTQVVFNSSWLNELGTAGLIALASNLTVARMLERDDFSKRYSSNTPIAVSEFLYPLLQGYDSIALNSDVELGGTDQKFNLLMGRTLQKAYNSKKQQAVLMMPILEGLDGVQKMSKSLGNYIGVTDEPFDMFGKILSISDELMWRYYELLSSKSLKEIEELKINVENGSKHPKKVKEELAMEIVDRFHGAGFGEKAKDEFEKVFAKKDIPTEIEEFHFEKEIWICQALVDSKLVDSTSQARRDIKANAVSINQEKINDDKLILEKGEYILQKGKKSFAKILIK